MSDTVIKVEGLGKRYVLSHQAGTAGSRFRYRRFSDALIGFVKSPFRRKTDGAGANPTREEFWALNDVSFEVKRGDVVGIIGRNGAGKSTLLKILSRIVEPTKGRIEIDGRVASLLEVGTGFHPELTGRENIFLNGAILGMTRSEVRRKFDEIVAFAEVEKFLDTPVKHYSSGMYVRLAFAVAAHLEPEILIVDEVLAVGDAAFQAKCIGKMGDVARQEGRTILFVSHNMQAVSSLCTQAILLDNGNVLEMGNTSAVRSSYLNRFSTSSSLLRRTWNPPEEAPGNEVVRFHQICIATESAEEVISMMTPFAVEIEYWHLQPEKAICLDLVFYAEDGSAAFESFNMEEQKLPAGEQRAGLFRSRCHIPGNLLNEGYYRIRIQFIDNSSVPILNLNDALTIMIHDFNVRNMSWFGRCYGPVHPRLKWDSVFLQPIADCPMQDAVNDNRVAPL